MKGVKLHCIPDWAFDVTDGMQLGGEYAARLVGPTPADLVPADVPAVVPPGLQRLPHFTQRSQEAMDVHNWRI